MHLDRGKRAQSYARQYIAERKYALERMKDGELLLRFKDGVLTKVTEQEIKISIFEVEWAMLTGMLWPTMIPPTRLLENHRK